MNALKYSTLPSLAFAIYRSNFLKNNKIPVILSKLHYLIKESYFGGITEVYKPYGEDVRSYDVNSLYPFAIKTFPMPVGKITYFCGDIYPSLRKGR